jgi:serine/threonine protein kinase
MGTLLYMSPESIQNKLMLASDVYSCGIVLYIMATRRIPFRYVNEAELMHKI